jgi:hypothetical protein
MNKYKLRKEINEAITNLEKNVDKNWREIEKVESSRKHKMKNMRLIHELFFTRII